MDSQTTEVTVSAVMTAPRHEIVWVRNVIEKAIRDIGIPLNISGGVFYGQCMQIMLQELVDKGVDYAITIDFDSVFTADDVRRLMSIIVQQPEVDAITAIQPKRGCGDILGARFGGDRSVTWDGKPIKVDSAHFGLTVIDLKKLASVPKPWFHHKPNADGEWTGEKTDDDVWFWRQWNEAGNSIYIDPGVRLGHLEEMVTIFDEQMKLTHIYPKKWSEQYASQVDS